MRQSRAEFGQLPDLAVACVGGGSNAIGTFHPMRSTSVSLLGIEAGGKTGRGAASLAKGGRESCTGRSPTCSRMRTGRSPTPTASPPASTIPVGPEHAFLRDSGRVTYRAVKDSGALRAFHWLAQDEGILPALESAHAVYAAVEEARRRPARERIVVTLSGRGDKDLEVVLRAGRPRA